MEGKPLLSAFKQAPEINRIPSWENADGEDGRLRAGDENENPAAAQAALNQLVELGYIAAPTEDVVRQIEAKSKGDFNIAASLCEAQRAREGKGLLANLIARQRDEPPVRYWLALAQGAWRHKHRGTLSLLSKLWNARSLMRLRQSFYRGTGMGR